MPLNDVMFKRHILCLEGPILLKMIRQPKKSCVFHQKLQVN